LFPDGLARQDIAPTLNIGDGNGRKSYLCPATPLSFLRAVFSTCLFLHLQVPQNT
jgi:hypothetical protein